MTRGSLTWRQWEEEAAGEAALGGMALSDREAEGEDQGSSASVGLARERKQPEAWQTTGVRSRGHFTGTAVLVSRRCRNKSPASLWRDTTHVTESFSCEPESQRGSCWASPPFPGPEQTDGLVPPSLVQPAQAACPSAGPPLVFTAGERALGPSHIRVL